MTRCRCVVHTPVFSPFSPYLCHVLPLHFRLLSSCHTSSYSFISVLVPCFLLFFARQSLYIYRSMFVTFL